MSGPYREPPEVPPCAQHDLVMVLDEDGGAEVWCSDCEKLWWCGRKSGWDFWSDVYRILGEAATDARQGAPATTRTTRWYPIEAR